MQEYVEGYKLQPNESIWENPKTGKKYVRKEFTTSGQKNPEKTQKERKKQEEDLFYYVALKYPQYTVKDLYENIPVKQVTAMAKKAQVEEAKWFLTLNTIINGPNVKSKRKTEYEKTISDLVRIVDPDYDKKKLKTQII